MRVQQRHGHQVNERLPHTQGIPNDKVHAVKGTIERPHHSPAINVHLQILPRSVSSVAPATRTISPPSVHPSILGGYVHGRGPAPRFVGSCRSSLIARSNRQILCLLDDFLSATSWLSQCSLRVLHQSSFILAHSFIVTRILEQI